VTPKKPLVEEGAGQALAATARRVWRRAAACLYKGAAGRGSAGGKTLAEGARMRSSSETQALFSALAQSASAPAAAAIETLVQEGEDADLNRINALDFAARRGLPEEDAIGAFLHATRLGLFDLSWNVLCPGCGGVLEAGATLKTVRHGEYPCSLCAAGHEPTLDEMVEATFTVNPNLRRIAAHDPDSLPPSEYLRQMFWASSVDLPEGEAFDKSLQDFTLDSLELAPGEKASISLQAPEAFLAVFDPVAHVAQYIEVTGEPTRERQTLAFVLSKDHGPTGTASLRPGPLRIQFDNLAGRRTLPAVWINNDAFNALIGKRRPFLTAKRLLTNQTFRDLYRTDTIAVDQRLKITSLTFLFTDLKGSTELYDRVGDLAAYDLVNAHFRALQEIVASEAGAVVKTIGDAVMATFQTPDRAVSAALRMRAAMRDLGSDLILKIGIHEGPCLAVMLNERQDYFGQTVNIAARVQGLATSSAIFATGQVIDNSESARLLESNGIAPTAGDHVLRGIAKRLPVYELP
jgi:class 3 adenylate cyclase